MQTLQQMTDGMPLGRRHFLELAAGVLSGSLMGPLTLWASTSMRGALASDPRRPQFHLLPTHNWMNDPNGPIYFDGKYHMYFQYNPQAAVWGNMSWNHAISDDMIHWRHLDVALTMTPDGPDAAGCFSGSTIAVSHGNRSRVYAIYTGVVRDKAHETIRNEGLRESQCLAWSDDPLLKSWRKHPEPVIPGPPPGLHVTGFRDPSVWKYGDTYLMGLGAGIAGLGGCVLLYRSTDLFHWQYLHPLAVGSWTGVATSNPVDDGEMWECPELFAVDGAHVLMYSSLRKVFWQSGDFDPSTLTFRAKKGGLLDLEDFYAPKTQLDARSRRILWGWIPERRANADMVTAGWSGMMSLPRVLNLDPDGTLRVSVIPEFASLRRKGVTVGTEGLQQMLTIPRSTGEAVCTGTIDQEMSFSMQLPTGSLRIHYAPETRKLQIGTHELTLRPEDRPQVDVFLDGSVAELIISGQITLTRRFYYKGDIAPDIHISASGRGVRLVGWEIAPISSDRLTSEA